MMQRSTIPRRHRSFPYAAFGGAALLAALIAAVGHFGNSPTERVPVPPPPESGPEPESRATTRPPVYLRETVKLAVVDLHECLRKDRADRMLEIEGVLSALDLNHQAEIRELVRRIAVREFDLRNTPAGTDLHRARESSLGIARGELEIARSVHRLLLRQRRAKLMADYTDEIRDVIALIGLQEGGLMVLPADRPANDAGNTRGPFAREEDGCVLYADPGIDITDAVIARLNGGGEDPGPGLPEDDLLREADRLWPINDEDSITLYEQLLRDYRETPTVQRNWVKITKRAAQKDEEPVVDPRRKR